MSEFAFYRMKPEIALTLHLPDVPYPARTDHVNEIFGGEKVAIDGLLRDLDLFLQEQPELRPQYTDAVGRLAYIAGVNANMEDAPATALRYFETGLAAVPENLSLRANLGVTLHRLDREEEALAQYEKIFVDPDQKVMPIVWFMAARLYAKQGRYDRAYWILRDCEPMYAGEERFRDFLKEIQEKAGIPDEATTEASVPSERMASTATAESIPISSIAMPLTCPRCGNLLRPGIKFCGSCSEPVPSAPQSGPSPFAAAPICPRCRNPIKQGAKFCRSCGQPIKGNGDK